MPSLWSAVGWALQQGGESGMERAGLAWRTAHATLTQPKPLKRWMAMVWELKSRGLIDDLEGEYLRAVRPSVHRGTAVPQRAVQLIDHTDWLEQAFAPDTLDRLWAGKPVVLVDLPPPRGFDTMQVQLRRAPVTAPEGELILSLNLQRSADIQHKALPIEAAAMGFSRFRIEGSSSLVIGGVRGQRHPVARLSQTEMGQALQGWKPSVMMVRVAQELARYWGLQLIGLDPSAHRLQDAGYRWNSRNRDAAQRIAASYGSLWDHFEAERGADGWMRIPLNSDDKLAATALSPEKRARQTRRADFWIRLRKMLRTQMRLLLLRQGREVRLGAHTQELGPRTMAGEEDYLDDEDFTDEELEYQSRIAQTGPGNLM
jgi:uncharacterized protein VirK/YbjX